MCNSVGVTNMNIDYSLYFKTHRYLNKLCLSKIILIFTFVTNKKSYLKYVVDSKK